MRRFLALLAVGVLCSSLHMQAAVAAEPTKIKVGVLLPLTGAFAAVAETQKQGAELAVEVVPQPAGLRSYRLASKRFNDLF